MNVHPATLPIEDLLSQCTSRRQRRSGPGGQHRNKVETAVTVTHTPTGVTGAASERRSQEANRQAAIFRLRLNLAITVRSNSALSEEFAQTSPSELWHRRCRGGRISVNPTHDDFPALLAEALDAVTRQGFDIKSAAELQGCSSSQLIKLIKQAPQAFTQLNDQRHAAGLGPLK